MRKFLVGLGLLAAAVSLPAQQMVTETRDPAQQQDPDFEKSVKEWTGQPYFISPLVDHLPVVKGIPSPKDVLGYHVGAPAKLTYYADILKFYRALAAATPRVKIASSSWCGSPPTRTSRTCSRTATTWRRLPIPAVSRRNSSNS